MEAKQSSIVTNEVYTLKEGQFYLPTWGVIVVLIIALLTLKTFIYIKDEKRHGK
tara:strand:+ start:567053 stop:567214 length:162 start_codon:yes stop_codon:yes gene_type:complete